MKVLIIGSGGREHALGWKLRQSPKIKELYFAPGNGGTAQIGKNITTNPHNQKEIVTFCKNKSIDLVIIGPDEFLAEGLADILIKNKIKVFGPTKIAARIEWSKSFAKRLMKKEGIPTADFKEFSKIEKAEEYVRKKTFPIVIKADGLAAGKGVFIAKTQKEASAAISQIMKDKIFGKSGAKIVIEEYLEGTEISVHAFCDGTLNPRLFPASQDHKRIYDNDKGPNTGGMGTISPVPGVPRSHMQKIKEQIIIPTLKALNKQGHPFRGILFPGIMLTKDGPKVIEFNARFGDPETQVYMPLLETDILEIMLACIDGTLKHTKIRWSKKSCCCVILASKGYPGKFKKGLPIKISENEKDNKNNTSIFFHAGTTLKGKENRLVTNGGRIVGVTATGNNLKSAINTAYASIKAVEFSNKYYRKDIGKKASQAD
jgi:phosphoribosylamine--glycine ligase